VQSIQQMNICRPVADFHSWRRYARWRPSPLDTIAHEASCNFLAVPNFLLAYNLFFVHWWTGLHIRTFTWF